MSYERLAYADHDSAEQMRNDCTACTGSRAMSRQRIDPSAFSTPAPPLRFDPQSANLSEPRIEVSEAVARLASRMHLHLD